jgi:HAD superfamily hydrolase (TIGR01490 family)
MSVRAAYCDVDGTLTATTIVRPLIWYKRHLCCPVTSGLWLASLPLRAPYWMIVDRFNRGASNRAIYSNYGGMPGPRARELGPQCAAECLTAKLYPQARETLAKLKADGVKIVIVTGGLDFVMQPFAAALGAECFAPGLEERDGVFTGALSQGALTGEKKAEAVRAHAAKQGVNLAESFAFGDAMGDLAMMECVGHPVAVNPDGRLDALARERGWKIERWGGRYL